MLPIRLQNHNKKVVSVDNFEIIINYLKNNIDKEFESPRRMFQRKSNPIEAYPNHHVKEEEK